MSKYDPNHYIHLADDAACFHHRKQPLFPYDPCIPLSFLL